MIRKGADLLVLVAVFMNPLLAPAQENLQPEQIDSIDEAIEEIIVFGERSMPQLKEEMFRAQENFFTVFSALNNDEEFDVRCFYETPTGTRIKRHVCRANFVTNANSAYAKHFRTRGPRYPVEDPEAVVMRKSREFERKMLELIANHPELQEALDGYTKTRLTYETERQRRFKDE